MQNIIRTKLEFDIPIGEDLAKLAAASANLTDGIASLAKTLGIAPADIKIVAQPQRIRNGTDAG